MKIDARETGHLCSIKPKMEREMSSLRTDDPTVAVLIERIDRLMSDHAEFRNEMREDSRVSREEIQEVREEFSREIRSVRDEMSDITAVLKNGKFLWGVVTALGVAMAWGLGVWDKIHVFFK